MTTRRDPRRLLRALLDTTVFCGALVKPSGGNMRILRLASANLFVPIVSQMVLGEFVRAAVIEGLGKDRRKYPYAAVQEFLEAVAPLLARAEPVGLRSVLDLAARTPPRESLRRFVQRAATRWPSGMQEDAWNEVAVAQVDSGDLHVFVAVAEHRPDVLVTSNTGDLRLVEGLGCKVERPSAFLARFDADSP